MQAVRRNSEHTNNKQERKVSRLNSLQVGENKGNLYIKRFRHQDTHDKID